MRYGKTSKDKAYEELKEKMRVHDQRYALILWSVKLVGTGEKAAYYIVGHDSLSGLEKISDEIVKVCMDYSETWGTIFDGSHTKAIGESGAIYYLFGAPEKTTNNTLWNEWISAMHIIGSKDATLQELILKLPKA